MSLTQCFEVTYQRQGEKLSTLWGNMEDIVIMMMMVMMMMRTRWTLQMPKGSQSEGRRRIGG